MCWYATSVAGPSHEERGISCQDSWRVVCVDGFVVAAVADGVGSESHADEGSRVSADSAVSRCARLLADSPGRDVESAIREAFRFAYDAVLDIAGCNAGQYDSTLTMAVMKGGTLWWGHVGDSGIVACLNDGRYVAVTAMQRDDQGRVFPLCFDDRWEFGRIEDVASFLACTDGMFEPCCSSCSGKVFRQSRQCAFCSAFSSS